MHDRGIVHRDIKLENFIYKNNDTASNIKLIDFGFACLSDPEIPLTESIGTPLYVAPEVLMHSYDYRCDVWSLGVMMHILLYGYPPFDSDDQNELLRKILYSQPDFDMNPRLEVSPLAQNLVSKLLNKDPSSRITLEGALNDPWIKMSQKANQLSKDDLKNLIDKIQFSSKATREKLSDFQFVHYSDQYDLRLLTKAFRILDNDYSGGLSFCSLKGAIKKHELRITDTQLYQIMKPLMMDGSSLISYSSFLAATAEKSISTSNNRSKPKYLKNEDLECSSFTLNNDCYQ